MLAALRGTFRMDVPSAFTFSAMVLRVSHLRLTGVLPDKTLVGGISQRNLHVSVRLRTHSHQTQSIRGTENTLVWRDELVFVEEPDPDAQAYLSVKGAPSQGNAI